MRRRVALASLVVVLLAILAAWWWRGARLPSRPSANPAAPSLNAPPIVAKPATPHAPLPLSPGIAVADPAAARGAFVGRVLSTGSGRGVAGATLTFLHEGAAGTVTSDGDGDFTLVPWAAGHYQLASIVAEGYLPFAPAFGQSPAVLEARPGERVSGVVLWLEPAVEYTGEVLDPSGKPVAGARVRVGDEGAGGVTATAPIVSDAQGAFRCHAAEWDVITAEHGAWQPTSTTIDYAAQASRHLTLRFARARDRDARAGRGAISGTVVDERDAPIDGAVVVATARGDGATRRVTTGPDGSFALRDLDAERYTVEASQRSLAAARRDDVPVGTRDLTLRLATGGTIRGVVRDGASGKPVAAFTLLVAERRGELARGDASSIAVFDAEGRYEVRGLAPGPWAVSAAAHGYAPSRETVVEVGPAMGAPATADFTLARGARITGRVIDRASRAALPGARISVEGRASDASSVTLSSSVEADGDGAFALGGLAPGLHSLVVTAAAHDGRILSGLRVTDGDLGPITVDLAATADGEDPHMEMTGIGAVLSVQGDRLTILKVLPGGGAADAGLQPLDAVLRIDGQDPVPFGFAGAMQLIRGPEGSVVVLTVARGDAPPTDVPVVRKRVTF